MSIKRTLVTVSYLRPIQVVDRVLRPLRRWRAGIALPLPTHTLYRRKPELPAHVHAQVLGDGRFRFINETRRVEGTDRWDPAGAQRLWTYHLHYFQYVHDMPRKEAKELILDWIRSNPLLEGPGWEPYPLSMRIREWIEWLLGEAALDEATEVLIVKSLVRQVDALKWQVEHHLQGNHLFENAITLCWAGLSLVGSESSSWRRAGLALLDTCVRTQVLGDGSHDERSPMYQALLAEALFRLRGVASESPHAYGQQVQALAARVGRALAKALAVMVHPDGDYALLQDTALGLAATVEQLRARFGGFDGPQRATPGFQPRSENGYYAATIQAGSKLIFDAGPIGPTHQPGHGHAGALGFELSHAGRRLVTDTGVFSYEAGRSREWDRSTAAHNTIEVDAMNQSDVWASFRCAQRIRVRARGTESRLPTNRISGEYETAPGGGRAAVFHRRTIQVRPGALEFEDRVRCKGRHHAVTRLHLAPGVQAIGKGDSVQLSTPEGHVVLLRIGHLRVRLGTSVYHPTFGVEMERTCVSWEVSFSDQFMGRWGIDLH